jgi:uncharacterized SAM-binding protein YcdF (DUF218 family)
VPRPLAPYGEVKLGMEEALRAAAAEIGAAALVGRISNLYGPGQDLSKPQGLISRVCIAHLTRAPLPVMVSLDTMRDYLIDAGIPPEHVVGDYAGFSTWDSCARANEVFGVEAATVVTQDFHLPRAVALCQTAGIDAALAAGGTLVSDEHAPTFWVVSDPDGNKVSLCTWQPGDTTIG